MWLQPAGEEGFGRRQVGDLALAPASSEDQPGLSQADLDILTKRSTGLAARHRELSDKLARRQSQIPDLTTAESFFPSWLQPHQRAILQPPKPEIPPAWQFREKAAEYDLDWEAGG